MHERQRERKQQQQQQHMWSPPSQRSAVGNPVDQKVISKGGRALNVGDCALFQAGDALPYIGILREVTSETVDQVNLTVNWLYRPADLKLAKGSLLEAAPNEIFYSFHRDVISEATYLHPCKVAFLRKGIELPDGVSSLVCRRVYDTSNKCLWWLSDRDYTNEHQEEVDELLDRTKLEMQAATQSGGPSPRILPGSTTFQHLKGASESVQNGSYSAAGKCKKRERSDQNLDPSKRERNVKLEDAEASPLKRERSMKPEDIISNLDKDGGLVDVTGVDSLVQLMQQDQNDGGKKVTDITARRTKLANILAATEKEECLNYFLHSGGLRLLDEWLQEAHKGKAGDAGSPREGGDKGVEELLLGLLRALDRLPVDLKALQTCVVGKSVSHLIRSHKNLEIQKKARKLIDVWKKRVDTELKQSGDVKPGGGNVMPWSFKMSPSEPVHSVSVKDPGAPVDAAAKTSGGTAGPTKVVQNGPSSGDGPVKLSDGQGKVASPTLPAAKDNNSKVPAGNFGTDVHVDQSKDEKSSSSSHSPSNGHSLASGAEKSATMPWKDEAKNGVGAPGKGASAVAGLPSSGQARATLSGASKEVGPDKSAVWNKNTVSEKGGSLAGADEKGDVESGGPQQRLVVRIPNPAKSPARASGDDHVSRSSSPSAPERQSSTTFDRLQQGEVAENVNSSAQVSVRVDNGTEKLSKPAAMDTAEGAMGLLATVAAAAEESGGEYLHTVDKGTNAGPVDMAVDVSVQRLKHEDTAAQSYVDRQNSGLGEGKSDRKEQTVGVTAEQGGGSEKNADKHNSRRDAVNGEVRASTRNAVKFPEGESNEGVRMDDVNVKLTAEHPYLKELKVKDRNGLESKPIGFESHLSSKFTRMGSPGERGLSRTHSKATKSAIELCNGIGVGLGDYRSPFGVPSVDPLLLEERPGRKRGQEAGQLFGRRGESDANRIADLVSGFPEEDVLEVARQAADEVEQMEKYGKPVSSSLSDRDAHDTRPLGISSVAERRDQNAADGTGRDRAPSLVLDNVKNVKSSDQDLRFSERPARMNFDDTKEDTDQKPGSTAETAAGSSPVEGHDTDGVNNAQKVVAVSSFSPKGQKSASPQDTGVKPSTPQPVGDNTPDLGDAPAVVSAQPERPVFDLNEGFAEENPQDDAAGPPPVSVASIFVHPIASGASASGVAAPIAVLAATKGAFIPPASPLRNKGDLGWKGSAATSAFRPAEPRRTPERLNSNGESMASDANLAMAVTVQKRARPLLEFDLNVADERVTHDNGVSNTTLSSQGSVLGMSLHSNSVPSSLVSGVTFVKQETSCVAFLKPESSSSAYPLSNGGSGPVRSSQGQAATGNGQGSLRSTLDLDLNRMDDSEENCMPLSVDLRGAVEGLGSSARSNNSTTQLQSQPPPQPPKRRTMDFDLNDGPSLEESGGEEPAVHPFLSRKPTPAANPIVPSSAMALSGLRMGGETMSLAAPWFSGPGNSNPGGALHPFLSGRPMDSGFPVAAANSFLNASAGAGPPPAPVPAGGGVSGDIFVSSGSGPMVPPAVVYPGPERITFGGPYGPPYSMFGNTSGFLSNPFPASSTPMFAEMSNMPPFAAMSNPQAVVTPGPMTQPPYLLEMGPAVHHVGAEHGWSRPSLDLNSGPEAGEGDSTREDVMHGRLPPLHPGGPANFTDLSATLAQVANNPGAKRKEPDGGWALHNGSGVGLYKQQSGWR